MPPTGYFNPYTDETFWGFFLQLLSRMGLFLTGHLGWGDLVSDEIQLIVLVAVSFSAALLGCFIVLRKMTMLANSLSHTILLGIVGVFFFARLLGDQSVLEHGNMPIQSMMIAALATGILTAFLTEFLTKSFRLQEDASTGLVFTTLFALGVVLVTLLSRNAHIGAEAVMGNVDALHRDDCILVFWVLVVNVILVAAFYKEYKITTFDAGLARSFGISTLFFNYLLMAQIALTVIGAFRAVGVLMVLAFITGPVLTARLLTHRLHHMIFLSMGIGALASLVGVALSRHLLSVYSMALSTAGVVVCVILGLFVLAALYYTIARVAFQKVSIKNASGTL